MVNLLFYPNKSGGFILYLFPDLYLFLLLLIF